MSRLLKQFFLKGIKIRFKGEANVQWSEQETRTNNDGKDERETITMLGEEVYFNTEYFLIGGQCTMNNTFNLMCYIFIF